MGCPWAGLVLGGGAARCRQDGLVLAVLGLGGRPGQDGELAASSWPGTAAGPGGRARAARRSIIETATTNAADGTAATTRPQASGWA
jgi:hypothetical protein